MAEDEVNRVTWASVFHSQQAAEEEARRRIRALALSEGMKRNT